MTKAEETLAAHGARLDNIEKDIGCMQPKLRAVEMRVADIGGKVDDLHARMGSKSNGRWWVTWLPALLTICGVASFMWYAASYLFVTRSDLAAQQLEQVRQGGKDLEKQAVWKSTVANTFATHDRELQATRNLILKVLKRQSQMREDQIRLMTRMNVKPTETKHNNHEAEAADKARTTAAKSRLPPLLLQAINKD